VPALSENNTGPFRRALSKTGFAYEAADIALPGRNDITALDPSGRLKPSGDTVYVYLGGRGSRGGEVDAGLQYSAAHDNWSLFLAVGGFGYTYGPSPGAPAHPRFVSGQTVRLEFEVIETDEVEVRATGIDEAATDVPPTPVTHAIRLDVSAFPESNANVDADRAGRPTNFGWNPSGAGNRLKRVTSMAQEAGHENFLSGSFVHGVEWANCVIGRSPGDAAPWSAANTSGFTTHPDNGTVSVDFASQAEETVSINL
jgi:hypothetical protein